jgi:hypothetical protein
MNNFIEQDYPRIKGPYHPIRGVDILHSAARFSSAHDELRDCYRHRTRMGEVVPLGVQREQFRAWSAELMAIRIVNVTIPWTFPDFPCFQLWCPLILTTLQ